MDVTNFYNYGTMNEVEAGATQINNYYNTPAEPPSEEAADVPEKLATDDARKLMERLVDGGFLDDAWQPKGLSGTERSLIAKAVSERLRINEVWQVFGRLWNEKPETLRGYLNKALDQKKSLDFQEKIIKAFV